MSCVNVTNVQVLENPAKFTSPLQFEISFECLSQLKEGKTNFECCIGVTSGYKIWNGKSSMWVLLIQHNMTRNSIRFL